MIDSARCELCGEALGWSRSVGRFSRRRSIHSSAFPLLCSAVLLLTAAATLRAQTVDATRHRLSTPSRDSTGQRLAPVEIRSSIAPTAGATVSSGVPPRISIVTRRQLDAFRPRLAADALGSQPGVSLYDALRSPWKINLSTRGFSAGPTIGLRPGISVLLDGVRQNEPDAQEINFDLLPMEHVERIEVLSGSSSGSNTDYYASGGYDHDGGWREGTGVRRYTAFLNVGRSGECRGISVQAFGAASRAEQLALSGYLPAGGG